MKAPNCPRPIRPNLQLLARKKNNDQMGSSAIPGARRSVYSYGAAWPRPLRSEAQTAKRRAEDSPGCDRIGSRSCVELAEKDIAGEPSAELIAIAEPDPALVNQARKEVSCEREILRGVRGPCLDEAKPEAVIVTTSNDRHLEILRQCAKRHVHYSTEKTDGHERPGTRGEMERLARAKQISS